MVQVRDNYSQMESRKSVTAAVTLNDLVGLVIDMYAIQTYYHSGRARQNQPVSLRECIDLSDVDSKKTFLKIILYGLCNISATVK